MDLAQLRRGASVSGDSGNPMDRMPDWMDIEKLRRGQEFFRKHVAAVTFALHCSLTVGFAINRLLDALVFNRASDTPTKAFRRYLETFAHIALWHTTDIWDANTPSKGHQSLAFVRRVHNRIAKAMNRSAHRSLSTDGVNKDSDGDRNRSASTISRGDVYISQYDMAVVQAGFVGAVIIYPESFGISHPSPAELDDYVFCWRYIGYLLGIADEYNVCNEGLFKSMEICKSIESELVMPGLYRTPSEFHRMTDAYIDGLNSTTSSRFASFRVTSKEATVAFSIEIMKGHLFKLPDWLKLTWSDRIKIFLWKGRMFLMKTLPGFENLLNWLSNNIVFKMSLPLAETQLKRYGLDHVDVNCPAAILS